MKKVILGFFAIVILTVAGVAFYGLQNLDALVKQIIEQVGTKVTGSKVSVASVRIDLKEGRGEIHGVTLANPAGFDQANIFALKKIALDITPESLLGDVIVIDEILIDGAEIVAEQKAQSTNLQALKKQLAKNTQGQSSPQETAKESSESTNAEPRLAIKKFSFTNNNAQLFTQQWKPQQLNVPNIQMTDLGNPTVGLTPEQLSQEVVSRLINSVEKAAKNALKEKAEDEAKKALNKELDKRLSDDDKKKLDSLKSVFGQ